MPYNRLSQKTSRFLVHSIEYWFYSGPCVYDFKWQCFLFVAGMEETADESQNITDEDGYETS